MIIPKWQLELEQFNSLKTTFILEGNIYDLQPYYKENEEIRLITLDNYLLYFILNLCAKFSLKSQPSIYGKYGKRIL